MKHPGTQTIRTERLILRRLSVRDAESMDRNWASDREVTKYLTWPPHESVEATRQLLARWSQEYEDGDHYQWGIELKAKGEVIGAISAVGMNEETETVEIGYCIGRAWWHQGIMTEALSAVIGFFFEAAGAERIEARHDLNNPHSGDVMKKCGMKLQSIQKAADRNNQGVCDIAVYAIQNGKQDRSERGRQNADAGNVL